MSYWVLSMKQVMRVNKVLKRINKSNKHNDFLPDSDGIVLVHMDRGGVKVSAERCTTDTVNVSAYIPWVDRNIDGGFEDFVVNQKSLDLALSSGSTGARLLHVQPDSDDVSGECCVAVDGVRFTMSASPHDNNNSRFELLNTSELLSMFSTTVGDLQGPLKFSDVVSTDDESRLSLTRTLIEVDRKHVGNRKAHLVATDAYRLQVSKFAAFNSAGKRTVQIPSSARKALIAAMSRADDDTHVFFYGDDTTGQVIITDRTNVSWTVTWKHSADTFVNWKKIVDQHGDVAFAPLFVAEELSKSLSIMRLMAQNDAGRVVMERVNSSTIKLSSKSILGSARCEVRARYGDKHKEEEGFKWAFNISFMEQFVRLLPNDASVLLETNGNINSAVITSPSLIDTLYITMPMVIE